MEANCEPKTHVVFQDKSSLCKALCKRKKIKIVRRIRFDKICEIRDTLATSRIVVVAKYAHWIFMCRTVYYHYEQENSSEK